MTQSEINDLVRQAREHLVHSQGGRMIRRHDWLRPDKLKKEHLRVIRSLHDAFCKTVSLTMSQSLRGQLVIDVHPDEGVQQTTYAEYLMRAMGEIEFTHPIWYTFSLSHASQALAAIEIPADFAYFMVDRLAGGKGYPTGPVRQVGEVERDLLRKLVSHFLADYASAWDPHGTGSVTATIHRIETDPQFLSLTPSQNDVLVCVQLKVSVIPKRSDDVSPRQPPDEMQVYTMRICLPYSLLEPILRDTAASRIPGQRGETEVSPEMYDRLAQVEVELRVIFGTTRITVGELMQLKPGDILVLDQNCTEPFRVTVAGVNKFLAGAGKVGTRKAIQILGEWRARRHGTGDAHRG